MKKIYVICMAVFCAMVWTSAVRAKGSEEKLPLDGQVRVGRLDNGMTYYIRHHENPKHRADFFITHNVGAMQEDDNQNGLAHFLEHMAFNGTKNFPDKGLLNYCASIGVRFGYNVNAYTSRDRTVYNVSNVPLLREGIVDSMLLIMHDWSYYISCDPEEIESERGVVREEWRRRDNARMRMAFKTTAVELAGSKYAERDVIGDPNIINTFERQTLVDFYHKWYRPDLQAVIVVGDVDLDQMEAKIREVMSTVPKAVNPVPKEVYTIPDQETPRFAIITDPEIKAIGVKTIYRQPYPTSAERATPAALRDKFARLIFMEMVRARLIESEKRPDAGYKRAVAVCGSTASVYNTFQITAVPKEENMSAALANILSDVEAIRRYGFTQSEFDKAKAKALRLEAQTVELQRQATNSDWCTMLVEYFTQNEPYMNADDRERIGQELFEGLALADLNRLKDEMVKDRNMLMIISTPDKLKDQIPSEQRVFALLDSVRHANISKANVLSKADQPLFAREVVPGKVVKTEKAPFGATLWTLSNGVKVFWRTVPEVIGLRKVGMYAVNRGGFNRDQDVEGLRMLTDYTRMLGVKDLDRNDIRDVLTSSNINMTIRLEKEYSLISGTVTKENLERLLQLTNLYMTEPNFSDEAYSKFIAQYRENLKKEPSPKAIYADSSSVVKYGDIPWLKKATLSTLDRFDAKAARALYDKEFGNAAEFVFFFAGEMPAEEVRPLIEKYIGSLPVVPVQKCPDFDMEILPGVKDYEYVSEGAVTSKSEIERYYHGTFEYTPENYATMRYLTYILGARYMKTVREEKGGTYHIGVQDAVGAIPRGYCYVMVNFDTDPKLRDMLLEEVQKGFEELAANAPTEQEVNEAKLYFKKANTERKAKNRKSTTYWLNKMETVDLTGVDLDQDNEVLFSAVTPEQVRSLAQSILSQGNRFTTVFTQK